MQGVGLFLMEELTYMPNGSLFTRGPSTYKIPSFNDIPIDFRVGLYDSGPQSAVRTVFGSKGVGEPPLLLAASAYLAVRDAVASARCLSGPSPLSLTVCRAAEGVTGPFRLDTPATCERIRMACMDSIVSRVAEDAAGFVAKGSF